MGKCNQTTPNGIGISMKVKVPRINVTYLQSIGDERRLFAALDWVETCLRCILPSDAMEKVIKYIQNAAQDELRGEK